jgi:PKD repeat protein
MENKLTGLDRQIRDTYEQYEVPFDSNHWKDLQKDLDAVAPATLRYFTNVTTGIAATGLVFLIMLFLFSKGSMQPGELMAERQDTTLIQAEGTPSPGAQRPAVVSTDDASSDAESDPKPHEDNRHLPEGEPAKVSTVHSASAKPTQKTNASSANKFSTDGVPAKGAKTTTAAKAEGTTTVVGDKKVTKGCTGLTIQFEAGEEYGKDAKYLWNFGDGFFSNDKNPTHTFNRSGTFDVSLSVTSLSSGQIKSNMVQGMIEVAEAPTATIEVDITGAGTITLRNKSKRAIESEWIINSQTAGSASDIAISLADNTRYVVQLAAYSSTGCTDTLQTLVEQGSAPNHMPEVLSATNIDKFNPSAYLADGTLISFKMFDSATGKLVHEGTGASSPAKPLQTGQYTWTGVLKKEDAYSIVNGSIELR